MAPNDGLRAITVRVVFGSSKAPESDAYTLKIKVKQDGSDTILAVKQLVADAAGGNVTPDDLLLTFGPNDRKMGKQFKADPTVDESKLLFSSYSVLSWLERFPHWTLSARLLPDAPPPPGVAIKQAAAMAEEKDPERAVQDGRAKGEIPKINELPAPWGPKPYAAPSNEQLVRAGYLPATYPEGSSPLVDAA